MNDDAPLVEAVGCKLGRIVRAGDDAEVKELCGPNTEIIDLNGKTVFPGFTDNHLHPLLYGFFKMGVDLADTKSIEEVKQKLKKAVEESDPGDMILGLGWNQENWDEGRYPTVKDIDPITPENPCFLTHYNFHIYFANSKLMDEKGITSDTEPPEGGKIVRDEEGSPTGVFEENAIDLIAPGFLESGKGLFSYEETKEAMKICLKEAPKKGVTLIGDGIADDTSVKIYQQLSKEWDIPVRVRTWILHTKLNELINLGIESGVRLGDKVMIAGVKFIEDGSLSSKTGALREPYEDDPDECGILRHSPEELTEKVVRAHKNNLRLHVHALGDRANDVVLNAFEAALNEKPDPDPRFHTVHCLVLSEDIIGRYKELGVIPQIQPLFLFSGQRWAPRLLGLDRLEYVHAWGKLTRAGTRPCAGTDAPIEDMDPIKNIYASVVRKDLSGAYFDGEKMVDSGDSCYRPEEKVSVHEAIEMLTTNSAYSTFEEHVRGTIEPGKFADLVVLSDDPYEVDEEDIKDIEVEKTIVDGKIVYEKK